MDFFKKRLTNGGEAGASGGGDRCAPSGPAASLPSLVSSSSSVSEPSPRLFIDRDTRLRSINRRDIPDTSLVRAIGFVKRFLEWCASAGITGPKDWPELFELTRYYAKEEEVEHFTAMAVAKAMTTLAHQKHRGLKKMERSRKSHETRNPRLRTASGAKRPRVVVYVLPAGGPALDDDDPQLNLFE